MLKKIGLLLSGVVGLTMLGVIISGIFLYNAYIGAKVQESTNLTLKEILEQQIFNFTSKIDHDITSVEIMSTFLSGFSNIDEITTAKLEEIKGKSNFESLMVIDRNGIARNDKGVTFDVSEKAFFHKALAGKTYVSEPVAVKGTDRLDIFITTPIIHDGRIIGFLAGSYATSELNKLVLPSFDGKGYSYVATNTGKIVADTSNEYSFENIGTIFDSFEKFKFYEGDDLKTIKEKLLLHQHGSSGYIYNSQKRIMSYGLIDINGWYVFSIVPVDIVSSEATDITTATAILSLCFLTIFTILVGWIFSIQKVNMKKLEQIAFYDELTGAPTLAKFKIDAQYLLKNKTSGSFIFVKSDIDNFKLINKMYGFEKGDQLLLAMVTAVKSVVNKLSLGRFAKVNVDEYIVMHEKTGKERLGESRDKVEKAINELMGEDFHYKLFMPVGIYILDIGKYGCDIDDALEKVNFAHSMAKLNKIEFYEYNEGIAEQILQNKKLENHMEEAMQNGEFEVFLQPKYSLKTETIVGGEALVRWRYEGKDFIYPNSFIPLFEKNGFITKLDRYIFEKACIIIKSWIDSGIKPVPISVNFSRIHLTNPQFVQKLCEIAEQYDIPKCLLEVEITESTIFDNEEILMSVLNQLHDAGFTLSMDDFGTGYSSLGLLKSLPVDVIKIDRSFFVDAKDVFRAKVVIENMIRMAKQLGIETVAEGVEIKEHVDLLKEIGCDIVQGYYYAKPMPESDFTNLLR